VSPRAQVVSNELAVNVPDSWRIIYERRKFSAYVYHVRN